MFKNFVLAAALLVTSTGCMFRVTPIVNTVDVSDVDWSNVDSMKRGTSCATHLFGVIPIGGTNSLPRAVKDAKISRVTAVANRYKSFIVYSQSCTEVWGE